MRATLEQRVFESIRRARLMIPGDRVAVGVSAGADSLALFRLLERLRDLLGITLLIVHFDHWLRGAESEGDARFVESLALEHKVEFVFERSDVAAAAARGRLNLEDAARRLRYAFFQRVVAEGRATRIAVAHTADDQAETVLARLFRGTGPSGLAGIYPNLGPVIRPLLEYRRDELRRYLRGLGQTWREDATNEDASRQRARIRAQLLPVLERDFSPRIVKHLGQLARLSREEREFWDTLVEDHFSRFARQGVGQIAIQICDLLSPSGFHGNNRRGLLGALRPLTERLIRRLYKGISGDCQNLGALHVEQVIRLSTEGSSGRRVELPRGVLVQRNFGELIFSPRDIVSQPGKDQETGSQASAYHYVVSVPKKGTASISIPELGTRLLLKVIDWSSSERDTRPDVLDADLLPSTLTFRNWQPGDAYRPRGHRRSRALKKMFASQRIPRSERNRWPVIESEGRIIWTRGMPLAGDFCVRDSTRFGVLVEEARP